jgi:pimeloyl-ACP methyl ester carboxylesterase
MATLLRDGVRLAYERSGADDGTPIALLPGWTICNSRAWAAQAEHLGGHHPLITYDARGSGASGRPADPAAYGVTELVADAVAVLDATATGPALLVGNSLGGLVGYVTAALHPGRVAGLVLVGPTIDVVGAEPSALQNAIAAFDEIPAGRAGWDRYNRHSWRVDFPGFVRWFTETALGPEATGAHRATGLIDGLDVTPDLLAATIAAGKAVPIAAQAAFLRGLALRVTCPTLLIHGDRDAICPPRWSRALADLIPGARLETLTGAGHVPHVTRAAETAHLIDTFAKEIR